MSDEVEASVNQTKEEVEDLDDLDYVEELMKVSLGDPGRRVPASQDPRKYEMGFVEISDGQDCEEKATVPDIYTATQFAQGIGADCSNSNMVYSNILDRIKKLGWRRFRYLLHRNDSLLDMWNQKIRPWLYDYCQPPSQSAEYDPSMVRVINQQKDDRVTPTTSQIIYARNLGLEFDPALIDKWELSCLIGGELKIREARELGIDPSTVTGDELTKLVDKELDRRLLERFRERGLKKGSKFIHRTYGLCTIERINDGSLTVDFFSDEKRRHVNNTMEYLLKHAFKS